MKLKLTEKESDDLQRILENELRIQADNMETTEETTKIENYSPLIQLLFSEEDL